MPENTAPQEGDRVRFTTGPLGLLEHVNASRFADKMVAEGEEGEYVGAHPSVDGWIVVKVGELFCPCHPSQIEVVR